MREPGGVWSAAGSEMLSTVGLANGGHRRQTRKVRSLSQWSSRSQASFFVGVVAVAMLTHLNAGTPASAAGSARVPRTVWTYDARPLRRLDLREPAHATRTWDTMHLLAALQGLVNRDAPRFYLFYCEEFGVDTDQFWFDWARTEDGWLREAEVRVLASLDDALREFRGHYDGLVVYRSAGPGHLECRVHRRRVRAIAADPV